MSDGAWISGVFAIVGVIVGGGIQSRIATKTAKSSAQEAQRGRVHQLRQVALNGFLQRADDDFRDTDKCVDSGSELDDPPPEDYVPGDPRMAKDMHLTELRSKFGDVELIASPEATEAARELLEAIVEYGWTWKGREARLERREEYVRAARTDLRIDYLPD